MFNIETLDSVDSTNNEAAKRLSFCKETQHSLNFKVIRAISQEKGRGQGKKIWESAKNENLTFSIIFSPAPVAPEEAFFLAAAATLSVIDFLKTLNLNAKIKWFNDIFVENEKIAGILIENSLQGNVIQHSIIGIGLNINQLEFANYSPKATSLKKLLNKNFEIEKMLENLLNCVKNRYFQLQNKDFRNLHNDYEKFLYKKDEKILFLIDKKQISGKILGVNHFGQLRLEISNEIFEYNLGEINFVF